MALPKEPRQKMINLMYLVLTALLALNLSAEILNAFRTINNSLATANGTIDNKNDILLKSFAELKSDPKTAERALIWAPKAEQAQKLSEDMNNYISGLKMEIMKAAGYNPPKDTAFNESSLEVATHIMSDPGTKGMELHDKLAKFKTDLLAIDPEFAKQYGSQLPIDLSMPKSNNAASKKDWGTAYFNMTPTIAALTILSKFQNDVKNSEAMAVEYCHQQVGAVKLILDQFTAFAGTNSTYFMPGQELQITAGVGAFSKGARPIVTIDGQSQQLNDSGFVRYKTNVGGTGNNYVKHVVIQYTKPDGTTAQVSKDITYNVGSPTGASVSADAVKVLYIGLKNPLSISGGSVGDEKVQVSIDNGNLTKDGAGHYISEPSKPGKANIHLVVDGKPQDFSFRVKTVPDPVAMVGVSKGGRMRVNEFKAQFGVAAVLDNFVFEGVKFNVTSYTLILTGAGVPGGFQYKQVTGDSFDPVRDLIEKAKPGSNISIDEIHATGPGGSRTLAPITFNLF
jgi:gliding motility-associated protein GldM